MLQSINPATGEAFATYTEQSSEEISRLADKTAIAQRHWRNRSFSERAAPVKRVAAVLRRDKEQHAVLMAREMGKPLEQGRAEIEKCAMCCDYFAEHAARFLEREEIPTGASRSYLAFEPLGLLLAIMPWNFPFWQVF